MITPPGEITPPINAENQLYENWITGNPEDRLKLEKELIVQLKRHAARVCWMVLRSNSPDLIDEIAYNAILELDQFNGDSLFSTWFHARALHRCYNERRFQRYAKKLTAEKLYPEQENSKRTQLDSRILVQKILAAAKDDERELLELKFKGYTFEEIAEILNVSKKAVNKKWHRLVRRLNKYYGSSFK